MYVEQNNVRSVIIIVVGLTTVAWARCASTWMSWRCPVRRMHQAGCPGPRQTSTPTRRRRCPPAGARVRARAPACVVMKMRCVLSTDATNAFNTVPRAAVMEAVLKFVGLR